MYSDIIVILMLDDNKYILKIEKLKNNVWPIKDTLRYYFLRVEIGMVIVFRY